MTDKEAIEMMTRCKNEIGHLKAVLGQLQPKADAYDNLVTVLRLLPRPSIGMGEDLCWILDKRIAEIRASSEQPLTTD